MYSTKKKSTVGHYDGERISRKYQIKVNGFRKNLDQKLTKAEAIFEEKIAKLISEEAHTRYVRQRNFYITDEVGFIVDFYFKSFKVAVEIDGSSHLKFREKVRDEWRDALLKEHAGVTTIRFTNKEVTTDWNGVFMRLVRFLATRPDATPSHRKYLSKVYADLLDG